MFCLHIDCQYRRAYPVSTIWLIRYSSEVHGVCYCNPIRYMDPQNTNNVMYCQPSIKNMEYNTVHGNSDNVLNSLACQNVHLS